jgi:hypothetical protein
MPVTDIVGGTTGNVTSATGFNADFDAWSATITMETAVYATFASLWKKSKVTTGNVTGSVSGVVQYDATTTAPMPKTGDAINLASFRGLTTLTAVTGCTIGPSTFNYTSVVLERNMTGEMRFTANIESDGSVDLFWDETG